MWFELNIYVLLISDRINQGKKSNNHMCLYSVNKKRNNNVGKNNSIDDKLQRKKKREEKTEDKVISVLVWMEYDRQLDTYISHDDIRLDLSIFEKFIDIIIIKL